MTATYYGSDKFKASRARTARRRYWRDPEKGRQRSREYRARKRNWVWHTELATDDWMKAAMNRWEYKGRLVEEVLIDDPAYLQWLTGPARADSVRTNIKELKKNLEYYSKHWRDDQAQIADIKQQIQQHEQLLAEQLSYRIGKIEFEIKRSFEERGVDVLLQVQAISKSPDITMELWNLYPQRHEARLHRGISIEIKPVIGDDYPAVLRQMKRIGANVLFVGEYRGQGASEDQFIKTMVIAGIRVVFARELDNAGAAPA
jgi:hypothetical protein